MKAKGTGRAIAFCATPRDYRVDASQPTQGTLVLDLAECSTGHLAWRAPPKTRVTGKVASEVILTALLRETAKVLPPQ